MCGGPTGSAADRGNRPATSSPPNRVKALVNALTHVAEVLVEAQRQDKAEL
jgi:hypothetical protein